MVYSEMDVRIDGLADSRGLESGEGSDRRRGGCGASDCASIAVTGARSDWRWLRFWVTLACSRPLPCRILCSGEVAVFSVNEKILALLDVAEVKEGEVAEGEVVEDSAKRDPNLGMVGNLGTVGCVSGLGCDGEVSAALAISDDRASESLPDRLKDVPCCRACFTSIRRWRRSRRLLFIISYPSLIQRITSYTTKVTHTIKPGY